VAVLRKSVECDRRGKKRDSHKKHRNCQTLKKKEGKKIGQAKKIYVIRLILQLSGVESQVVWEEIGVIMVSKMVIPGGGA